MSTKNENLPEARVPRLRRAEASRYLREHHGIKREPQTLAKLAVTGGGPEYDLFGRVPYYPIDKLDEWVAARLSRRRSTSDRGTPVGQKPDAPHPPLGRKGAPLESESHQTRNKPAENSSAHNLRNQPDPISVDDLGEEG